MSDATRSARPLAFTFTPAGGSATTLRGLKKVKLVGGYAIIADDEGASQVPYRFQGQNLKGLQVTTTDLAAAKLLEAGTKCTAAEGQLEGVRTCKGTKTGSTYIAKRTLTYCDVVENVELDSETGGKSGEYQITFLVGHSDDGASEGTVTDDIVPSP